VNEKQRLLFREALDRAYTLATGPKNADYNSGNVRWEDYNRRGPSSVLDMVWRKVLRLCSLEAVGFEARCEKTLDTTLDLINYAAFLYVTLREKNEH